MKQRCYRLLRVGQRQAQIIFSNAGTAALLDGHSCFLAVNRLDRVSQFAQLAAAVEVHIRCMDKLRAKS